MRIVKQIILLSFCMYTICAWGQVRIHGQTLLDSTWRKEIYASQIPSLNDFFTVSNSLIIAKSKIDSAGYWILEIPKTSNSNIIRIHVSKKPYPEASLIIGGDDNNHAFLAIGDAKELKYTHNGHGLFSDFSCEEDSLNAEMMKIKAIFETGENKYQKAKEGTEKIKIRHELAQELKEHTDTISSILPAIYAAHLSDMGFNKEEVHETMSNLEAKFGSHPYLAEYLITNNQSKTLITFIVVCGILLITYLLYRFIISYRIRHKKKLLQSLSGREIEVFNLVLETKSNKEIADILSVEISTVKSHLHSIYSKLKITSRNQLKHFS